jgi:hypothetical protein
MGKSEEQLQLIFLKSGLLLSRKQYASLREIQTDYEDYMTSLGPFSAEEVFSYFELDYGQDDSR